MNISIAAEQIGHIGLFNFTGSLLLTWVVVIGLVVVAQSVYRRRTLVPAGLQNGIETGIETLLDTMTLVLGTKEKAVKYFPFIATLFTLILASNWIGVLPGVGSIGFFSTVNGVKSLVPLLRSPASDLNFTLALALITVVSLNVMAVRAKGIRLSVARYINFSSPINFFIGILELIGEIAKIISLSFRLFGNVFAGEVLLIITSFLVPYIVPIPFLGLELFAGFIQALVFSTLSLVFLSLLTDEAVAH